MASLRIWMPHCLKRYLTIKEKKVCTAMSNEPAITVFFFFLRHGKYCGWSTPLLEVDHHLISMMKSSGSTLRQAVRRAKRLAKEWEKISHAQVTGETNIRSRQGGAANSENSPNLDAVEWFFVVPGEADTVFQGGEYLVRIRFSTDFPISPPSISFLTPNGRYHINDPICLNGVSDFHSENWSPTISVLSIIQSVQHSMNEDSTGIGSITESCAIRKSLAAQSQQWNGGNSVYRNYFVDEFRCAYTFTFVCKDACRESWGGKDIPSLIQLLLDMSNTRNILLVHFLIVK